MVYYEGSQKPFIFISYPNTSFILLHSLVKERQISIENFILTIECILDYETTMSLKKHRFIKCLIMIISRVERHTFNRHFGIGFCSKNGV